MARCFLLTLAVLISIVALSMSWAVAQSGGPPPQPAPGQWSVTVPGDQEDVIVSNSGTAATYRVTSNEGSSWSVTVIRLDSSGQEIANSGVELEPGESVDYGVEAGQGIKIKRRGTPNGSAGGTYQKV